MVQFWRGESRIAERKPFGGGELLVKYMDNRPTQCGVNSNFEEAGICRKPA